jgi:hypothetical protein
MRNYYEAYETNKTDEIDGSWYTDENNGVRVKLARQGGRNMKWGKVLNTTRKKYNIDFKNLNSENSSQKDQDKVNAFMIECFSKAIVKDWELLNDEGKWEKGIIVKDSKGEYVRKDFDVKHVIRILTDLPDLYKKLHEYSDDMKSFLMHQQEDDVKN